MQEKKYLKIDVDLINELIKIIGTSNVITPFRFNELTDLINKSELIQNELPKKDEE
ncbi:hypothetical protein [Carboxylicivirga sp. M1479]|uniref:hypothetical protein n=1 Tax=Carboxylicivirga sp. M1479 TaxID=2594476 RepID=UPI00163D7E52|nr:hypothetical protein [Carboxylicivirga sp. M1479]